MNSTKNIIVPIDLGDRSYDIHIGSGLLSCIQDYVPADLKGRNLFVLTDENVNAPYASQIYSSLKSSKAEAVQLLTLPAGEQTKSFENLERVLSWMLDHGAHRDSILFAVGGGVIGDLAGFAASIVMRGISFVQVPTSLLAQVDSSVGGKTAINVPQGKNLVGTFYQPISVICDIETLKTLPRRELLSGYAETVKYGLINDPEFFMWLEKEGQGICDLDHDIVIKAVEIACRKKAEIVKEDEKESGVRALLNLGHTFGHALEGAAGYDGRLLHGEAVAIGTVLAFKLSHRLGLCAESEVDRVEAHMKKIGLPTQINMISPPLETDAEKLMAYMKRDKKMSGGELSYIVVNAIGKAHVMRGIDDDDIIAILEHSLNGA